MNKFLVCTGAEPLNAKQIGRLAEHIEYCVRSWPDPGGMGIQKWEQELMDRINHDSQLPFSYDQIENRGIFDELLFYFAEQYP